MRDGWRSVPLGEVITHQDHREPVEAGVTYPLAGVYSFGRGLFWREPLKANKTKYKELHRLHAGQLVMSKLKAWEGALAVVPDEFDGAVLSPEFPAFTPGPCIDPEYLRLVVSDPAFANRLRSEARGVGGRRERVHPRRLLDVLIALPPLDEQKRIVDLIAAVHQVTVRSETVAGQSFKALDQLRDELLWGRESNRAPLGDLCSIEATLVDPAEHLDLPHIGVEKIRKEVGTIELLSSARDDGVTSAKFLLDPRDILYSKIRPNLRKVARPGVQALTSADAYPLRPKAETDPGYLHHLLLSRPFTDRAVERSGRTKMPKINRKELFSIEVPCPPVDRQRELGSLLDGLWTYGNHAYEVRQWSQTLLNQLLKDLLVGRHEIPESYDELLRAV